MQLDDPNITLLRAQSAVLLVFMPSERANQPQWADHLTTLTDLLQEHLGGLLRILRIDEAANPDVVRSFAITQTPTFVLVRQGVELWRQESIPDEATLVLSIQRMLEPDPVCQSALPILLQ